MAGRLAIVTSLISLYYYLQVIRQMYIQPAVAATDDDAHHVSATESDETPSVNGAVAEDHTHTPAHHESSDDYVPLPRPGVGLIAVVVLGLIATVALGVYPAPLLELVEGASTAILPGG